MAKVETTIPVGNVVQSGLHQIMTLRDLTYRFGMLHEIQVINLKVWPSVFLGSNAKVKELRYCHESRYVEIDLGDVKKGELDLGKGALALDRAVKYLLGVDVRTKVISDDGLLYEGGPQDESWLNNTSMIEKEPPSKRGKKKRASRQSPQR
jgi:uncharacterized protein with PhoU and TrkA domain